jgi:hypothetical protein
MLKMKITPANKGIRKSIITNVCGQMYKKELIVFKFYFGI